MVEGWKGRLGSSGCISDRKCQRSYGTVSSSLVENVSPGPACYFSVRDSCSILSSSSSSSFLLLCSSIWARADSSMARRSSASRLEAELDPDGLPSPRSTGAPSGMLLERQQDFCFVFVCKNHTQKRQNGRLSIVGCCVPVA